MGTLKLDELQVLTRRQIDPDGPWLTWLLIAAALFISIVACAS